MPKKRLFQGIIGDMELSKGVRFVSIGPESASPGPYTCDTLAISGGCNTFGVAPRPSPLRYAILIECDANMMTSRSMFEGGTPGPARRGGATKSTRARRKTPRTPRTPK